MPQDGADLAETQRPASGDALIASQKRPAHRPLGYNPQIAAEICNRIARTGSLARVCDSDDMPCEDTVYDWLNRFPDFSEAYYRARENVEPLIEQSRQLVSDTSNDVLYDGNGRPIPNGTAVKRAELRVSFNQWLAGKLSKRFADKTQLEVSGTITIELSNRLDNAIKRLEQQPIDVTPSVVSVQDQAKSNPDKR